jgi:N-acyl-D-aspartate/D-glutamate deacylase
VHDLVIRRGSVVDGTGAPRRTADVAIDGGRVTEIGADVGPGSRSIDADGLVVAPGFVDVHTHLDVQGFWDPYLTPSPLHGVTTAVGGNCGFSVAPLDESSAEYLMPMLARVEGMPLESLEKGVPWDWTSTEEYLDRLDGTLAINTGFMVGHCSLRRVVMGEAGSDRPGTPEEVEQMRDLLRAGLRAGALGFSSSLSATHNDAAGRPVPSRHATPAELIALAQTCGEFAGTSIEFLPGLGLWDAETQQLMIDMTVGAQRPMNWNLIVGSERTRDEAFARLDVSDLARAAGGKIVGLTLACMDSFRFSFRSGFILDSIDGWAEPMALPPAEKLALLASSEGRQWLGSLAAASTTLPGTANWGDKMIVESFTPATKRYEGRKISDIAAEERKTPFDALLDIVVTDQLRTSFVHAFSPDTAADWAVREQLVRDPRTVIGGSDTGAHLDMITSFSFATDMLARMVRERGLLSIEEAVHLLTARPADLYGLVGRGRLTGGAVADVVVFEEDTVRPGPVATRFDLPGGAGRLYAAAVGVEHVVVNGEPIVAGGELTGARPGAVLRSGSDTVTPAMV